MKAPKLKELAADILEVGVNRVRIRSEIENRDRIANAITREDVRQLIKEGIIYVLPKKPKVSKKKRKRKGPGRRKGTKYSRKPKKEIWMERIRALRKFLTDLVSKGKVDKSHKRTLYMKIKGGSFRGRKAFLTYLKDNHLLKE